MAITYHAGRRIQGTSTDATVVSGGWKELGRNILTTSQETLSVSGTFDKDYLMILHRIKGSSLNGGMRFNDDSGGSQYLRRNEDDGSEGTLTASAFTAVWGHTNENTFQVTYVTNKANKEKLILSQLGSIGTTGAGSGAQPSKRESAEKWRNTSDRISKVELGDYFGSGTFLSGTEIVVLGWDPDDTHTTNFWEQLADVEQTTAQLTLDSGTFTAKKYLWVEIYGETTTHLSGSITFNGEVSGNSSYPYYTFRGRKDDGSDDVSEINKSWIVLDQADTGFGDTQYFSNIFIKNIADEEKIAIINTVENDNDQTTSHIPHSYQCRGKWTNTSNQVTRITVNKREGGAGNYKVGSRIRVWGSD
jgi:hypothetical protein